MNVMKNTFELGWKLHCSRRQKTSGRSPRVWVYSWMWDLGCINRGFFSPFLPIVEEDEEIDEFVIKWDKSVRQPHNIPPWGGVSFLSSLQPLISPSLVCSFALSKFSQMLHISPCVPCRFPVSSSYPHPCLHFRQSYFPSGRHTVP